MNKLVLFVCALGGMMLALGLAYLFDKDTTGGDSGKDKAEAEIVILIDEVRGAPGDGNTSLRTAFGVILDNAGVKKTDTLTGCTVAVSAEVSTLRLGDNQKISIIWQVTDSAGARLGEVSQLNNVKFGALDGAWGTDASLAARGAWDGIRKIMNRPRTGCV